MDKTPQVSVLMPVYNGERYLREAVESIVAQTFTNFEFIIIDDGSTDTTGAILDSFDDPRIVRSKNEENIGLARSLNKGLTMARGEYIARMDADDISLPERLARQVAFLDAHPEVGVLGSVVQVIDGDGNKSDTLWLPTEHGVLRWSLCFGGPIAHPTVMMRREVVERVGGYNPNMVTAQDYDLWRRLSGVTRLSNLQDVLLSLRKHEASMRKIHLAEHRRNRIRISRLMMSEILGEDVPSDVVQHLWSKEFESADDVHQAARLIYRLYQASITDSTLSTTEKRKVRRDAARRLFRLARPRIRDVRVWGVLGLVCRLDLWAIGRAATGRLRRVVGKRHLVTEERS
jgi:glycosyltransferase involved in cell wall biosynthesis